MLSDIVSTEAQQRRRYVSSARHTIQVDYMAYTRDVARRIGADPSLGLALLRQPKLFWALLTGPQVPYMFRLQGPHAWHGAAQASARNPPAHLDAAQDQAARWRRRSVVAAVSSPDAERRQSARARPRDGRGRCGRVRARRAAAGGLPVRVKNAPPAAFHDVSSTTSAHVNSGIYTTRLLP
ncbi:hypothetical protein HPB48_004948 [Haemaphysalis longicornis]|uniref:Flavin-containing monooxygenase n=1 Tax=Haemaphysalis longicornis TaxID=44386 RepID=A0A9J6GDM9_HAELO|nr:hypothetical protein HPB48_004948 [Haemaphysalis longicornis]